MSIRDNIETLKKHISRAAAGSGRKSSEIIIISVVKNRKIQDIFEVLDAGINYIGENKVQEAQERFQDITNYAINKNIKLNYHMVGHLQVNKVNKALGIFNLIHSVDSLKLTQRINESSESQDAVTDILIEVNTSGEGSKFGVSCNEAVSFMKEICKLDNICVRGLMTMAPLVKDKEETRPYFRRLHQLKEEIENIKEPLFKNRIKMDFLSMGMSQDYEIAVQEGSNMVRIGTAIFEGSQ